MTQEKFFIYGQKPVEELLKAKPKQIEKVYVRNNLQHETINKLKTICDQNRIPFLRVPGKKIFNLVGKVNDQGIVAQKSFIEYLNLIEWLQEQNLKTNLGVLVLDGIQDPHNTGAIIRSAAAAGISAVVVPKHGQSPINATVHKTSAGNLHKIPVIRSHDTKNAITDLKSAGFYIAGLSGRSKKSIWELDFKKPIAFIIGNEGEGIQPDIERKCDTLAYIPMKNNVESLNASVSAALISYEWMRKNQ